MALTTGIIFGILSMLGWGFSDFFVKTIVDKIGAYKTFIYSFIIGTIPLILYFIFFPKFSSLPFIIIMLFIFGSLFNFMGYLFFYKGLEVEKVSILSPIVACSPIIVIILGILVLKEFLSLNQGIGISFAIAGLILTSVKKKGLKIKSKKGVLFGMATMLTWGIAIFSLGYLAKGTNWLLAALLFRILTWLYGFIFFKLKKISLKIAKINLIYMLILIGILDMAGVVFYAFGASTELISIVGPISALYPAVTLILARLFIKEKLILIQKIGIISILFGLFLISF